MKKQKKIEQEVDRLLSAFRITTMNILEDHTRRIELLEKKPEKPQDCPNYSDEAGISEEARETIDKVRHLYWQCRCPRKAIAYALDMKPDDVQDILFPKGLWGTVYGMKSKGCM